MAADILISNATILIRTTVGSELVRRSYLTVGGGRIQAIGPMADLQAGAVLPDEKGLQIDGTGFLVMPGLINTHTHAAMTLFRGLADDMELAVWLQQHIFPAEARYASPEMVYWCTKLAAAEMILSGTTTVADGYFHEEAAVAAFMDTGMRAVAAQGIIDYPAPGVPEPAKNIEVAAAFLTGLSRAGGLITPALFCHSPYTCSRKTLEQAKELARRHGVLFFIHVAETEEEVRQVRQMHDASPVGYLNNLGILDELTVCVHCVWLEEKDIGSLARSRAKIVTCPESNMKLASGIAPLAEMLGQGIVVGLGTDGCASNNNLDLFGEMDMCAKLHKVKHRDPTVLPARQVLDMATAGGARVLGLAEVTGSLAPGMAADIIMVDLQQPHLVPFYNQDLLVYGVRGADVHTVIIDGRLVMRNRRILTFDPEEAMARVRDMSRGIKD